MFSLTECPHPHTPHPEEEAAKGEGIKAERVCWVGLPGVDPGEAGEGGYHRILAPVLSVNLWSNTVAEQVQEAASVVQIFVAAFTIGRCSTILLSVLF